MGEGKVARVLACLSTYHRPSARVRCGAGCCCRCARGSCLLSPPLAHTRPPTLARYNLLPSPAHIRTHHPRHLNAHSPLLHPQAHKDKSLAVAASATVASDRRSPSSAKSKRAAHDDSAAAAQSPDTRLSSVLLCCFPPSFCACVRVRACKKARGGLGGRHSHRHTHKHARRKRARHSPEPSDKLAASLTRAPGQAGDDAALEEVGAEEGGDVSLDVHVAVLKSRAVEREQVRECSTETDGRTQTQTQTQTWDARASTCARAHAHARTLNLHARGFRRSKGCAA